MTPLDWFTPEILTFVSSVRTMSLPMMLALSAPPPAVFTIAEPFPAWIA